jgi:hypothetical protein
MRRTILLSIVLMAAFTGCGGEKVKTMTLDICGAKKIQNPMESYIRREVFALDTKNEDAFLILARTEMTYIQTGGDKNVGFKLEYQEGDIKHHYQAKRDLTADEIVKALVAYSAGADDWRTIAEWKLITW